MGAPCQGLIERLGVKNSTLWRSVVLASAISTISPSSTIIAATLMPEGLGAKQSAAEQTESGLLVVRKPGSRKTRNRILRINAS